VKKRLLTVLMVVILALAVMTPALALVEQSKDYYVTDAAGVLSDKLEQKIISSNADLEQKCDGAQIVVVTVQYLDGMYADEYATTLFNTWGVGDKDANNGMLLLLATGENKAWLSVGAGISGSFTGKMVDDYFSRYFWDDFDRGDYETATSNMLEALFSWFADYYNVNQNNGGTGYNNGYDSNGNDYNGGYDYGYSILSRLFTWGFVVLIIVIVFLSAMATDRRRHVAYYTHLGMPIPPYYFWFLWGGPHRTWWYGPGGPGWRNGPRGPRGPGGFGGGPRGGGGGFGGFGGRGGGGGFGGFGGGGMGRGGGGFSGGGGGRR
jgi:uncharacterized protein